MIDYQAFRFASPPRTATTWFRKVAADSGLEATARGSVGVHIPCPPQKVKDTLNVTIVRNPVDWLVSYYLKLEGGHIGVWDVDRFVPLARASSNLEAFLLAYLSEAPGSVGSMFGVYNADTVLRVEDLPWAAQSLLEAAGGRRSRVRQALQMPPQNIYGGVVPIVDRKVRVAIMKAEKKFCEAYDYWD